MQEPFTVSGTVEGIGLSQVRSLSPLTARALACDAGCIDSSRGIGIDLSHQRSTEKTSVKATCPYYAGAIPGTQPGDDDSLVFRKSVYVEGENNPKEDEAAVHLRCRTGILRRESLTSLHTRAESSTRQYCTDSHALHVRTKSSRKTNHAQVLSINSQRQENARLPHKGRSQGQVRACTDRRHLEDGKGEEEESTGDGRDCMQALLLLGLHSPHCTTDACYARAHTMGADARTARCMDACANCRSPV